MDILEPYALPFALYVGDTFVVMQENSLPQAARWVVNYL